MKVAISVPDPLFDAAERLAEQRHMPRSRLFAEALKEYIERHGPEAITEKLDVVHAKEKIAVEEPLMKAQLAAVEYEAW